MNIPHRKQIRLPKYNYSQNGVYFITICAHNHKCIFGSIKNPLKINAIYPDNVGYGACDIPFVELSHSGEIVDKYINFMGGKYDYVNIDKYIIMPNHIHLLIPILHSEGLSQAPNPTNDVIPKFISLFKRYCNREIGYNIWQKSFYEHIIRNEQDYLTHYEYIENNPIKWETDDYYIK